MDNYLNRILKYIISFFSVEILLALGSFISFPILTRILSKEDYGLMNIISISFMLITSIGSGGLNLSVARFYGKYDEAGKKRYANSLRYYSFILSLATTIIYIIIILILSYYNIIEKNLFIVFLIPVPLISIRIISKYELSLLRIQEKMAINNIVNLAIRYLGITGGILFLIYLKSLNGFYFGLGVAEFIVLFGYYYLLKRFNFIFEINRKMLKENFLYGLPFAVSTIFSYILINGDRYLLSYFMNMKNVAEYSVAYNYCNYSVEMARNTFSYAFIPIIMNVWNKKNFNASLPLIENFISIYFIIMVPIVVGLIAIKTEGILLLAGGKYSNVSYLVPIILIGIAINGLSFIFNIGLFYGKKTKTILYITIFGSALNIVLNIWLIPLHGMMGAAYATLISFICMAVMGSFFSKKIVHLNIPYKTILLFVLSGFLMYICINIFPYSSLHVNPLLLKILIGMVSYITFILIFSKSKVISAYNSLFKK